MRSFAYLLIVASLLPASIASASDVPQPQAKATDSKAAKPSARGPGTQTEDELYIGAKTKVANKVQAAKPAKQRTGDEDLEDLEVQRSRQK